MSEAIRILAVDDHPLFREGTAALISGQPDMRLVAEASNGREAVTLTREHRPDIVLMDLQMAGMNGLDATMSICGSSPTRRLSC